MFRPTRALILALAVLCPPVLRADDAAGPALSQQIVVTASATSEELSDTPASATVITREQIDEQQARDVADVLRQVPGLNVSRSGSGGKATSLFTRGSNSTHTLVLWNGIEINNPYFSGYDWGRFSTSGVQRIEVIRGPFSALYGSDAVAGVVNILTAESGSHLDANVQSGNNGLFNGTVNGAWETATWGAAAAVERREDDGWSANDDFAQTAATAEAHWKPSASTLLGIQARHTSYGLGIPFNVSADGSVIEPSLNRRQEGTETQIAIPLHQSVGHASFDLTLSESRRDDDFSDPDDPFGYTSATTTSRTRRARLQAGYATASFGTIIGGAELERAVVDDVSSFGVNLAGDTRTSKSLFIEDRFSRQLAGGSHVEVSAGLRHDDFDTFGAQTSPRVAAAWISGANKFRAAWGESFRAPSVGELYFPYSGNSGLNPERSESGEAGFDRFFGARGMASVTLFRSTFQDLIVFDNASYRFENVGHARSSGVEVGLSGAISRSFDGALSYTYLDTSDDSGEELLRRPRHSGSVNLGWHRGAVRADLAVTHSGDRSDVMPVFPYSRIVTDAYTVTDVTLGYTFRGLEPYVKVENAADVRYDEVAGFASPGRRFIAGIHYSMR